MIWLGNAWRFCTAWPRGIIGWVHTAVCALNDEQGRKGWAMLAALGCCFVMTAEFAFTMWNARHNAMLSFWMGMSAQAVNFIVVTGLMVLLGVKRKTNVDIPLPGGGKISLGLDDSGQPVVVQTTPVPPAAPIPAPAPIAAPEPPLASQPPDPLPPA